MRQVDLSKLPDVAAVSLLTLAFFSVARYGAFTRHEQTSSSVIWLIGWLTIVLHFTAFIFLPAQGFLGVAAMVIGTSSLAWAGILFMWASLPYRGQSSSYWLLLSLLATNTFYFFVLSIAPHGHWLLQPAAVLIGALPLLASVSALRADRHPLRWTIAALYSALSVFLLVFENRPGIGPYLAVNAVLFTVYAGCCIHFWIAYRRATTGAFITVAGFFAWANVFTAAPLIDSFLPRVQIESEVWNLPKYVVAVGMILLLLEDQIEHNRFLALHDELTGLPNRRLFQDRLASALERARRSGSKAALLLIDLDRFKQVNDTIGHHAGDELLKHIAALFLGRVRRSDTVARTGGDEFSVILEEPVNRADAMSVARSLTHFLDAPIELGDQVVRIGASVGIAIYPEDGTDAESLSIAADLRMYDHKRSGTVRKHHSPAAKAIAQTYPLAD